MHAAMPSNANCQACSAKRSACVAPRQRIIAAASSWRCEKRRAASATATDASTTESSDASPRKRCERSRARRTSLLESRTPSIRPPEALELPGLAGEEHPVAHAAADLDQPRGREVRLVHQHARRDAEVFEHAVGLARDELGDGERRVAHLEARAGLHA